MIFFMVLVDYNIPVIQLWLRWCSLVLFICNICKCNHYRHQCTDSSTGWSYKHIFSTSWTTTGAIQCWSWCIYKTLQLLLDTCSNNSSRNAAAKPTKSETWRRVLTSGASLKPSLLCLTLMALNWQPEDESSSRGSDAPDFHNPDIIWEKSPEIWVWVTGSTQNRIGAKPAWPSRAGWSERSSCSLKYIMHLT